MTGITKRRWPRSLAAGAVAIAVSASAAASASAEAEEEEPEHADYEVVDGRVDPGTYEGYMAYTRACQACHGPDGLGSAFAPSLVQAAERRTFEEFARTIAEGLEVQPGQVMPSFADDEYVMGNVSNIWSYLNARADDELGRGRPQVIEELEDEVDMEEEG